MIDNLQRLSISGCQIAVPPIFSGFHGDPACFKQALLFYADQGLHFAGLYTSVACMSFTQQLLRKNMLCYSNAV